METRRFKRSEMRRILNDGLDISYKNRTVSYNPTHEENVETSLETNPTIDISLVTELRYGQYLKGKRALLVTVIH